MTYSQGPGHLTYNAAVETGIVSRKTYNSFPGLTQGGMVNKFISVILLLAATTGVAMAVAVTEGGGGLTPVGAPEIDPASAMSGLTLLLGSLAVLRGRRVK